MATYYWVGGSGTWDAATTTNWAASSGGSGSAGVPTSADSVIFDANSGASPTVTINSAVCSACTIGAPTSGTLTLAFGTSSLTMAGNLSITTSISVTGTGTINLSAANATFAGNGNAFYNVNFTSTAITGCTISGSNAFNNLSFAARSAAGFGSLNLTAGTTNTISGTLTLGSGITGNARLFVRSTLIGSPATLSVAVLSAITDIDFRDIVVSGASAPWSGTRIGDCLGNSNITFTAARTVYWVSAASGSWTNAAWSTTSGNTGGTTTAFPLAQDTIVIDNAGLAVGNSITLNASYQIGTLDFSSRSNAATFATGGSAPAIYGDYVLSSAITVSGTGTITFAKQSSTATITSAGKTFTQPVQFQAPNGTVRIDGDLTLGPTVITALVAGTLDLTNNGAGNYTFSVGFLSSNVSSTRSITFGTGNITLTGNATTVWAMQTVTGFSYTGTPTVNATYSGSTGTRTFAQGNTAGATENNVVSFNISAGSDIISLAGTFFVKNLNFTGFTGTLSNAGRTIYGNLTLVSGMTLTAGASTTTFGATSGTHQITTAGNTLNFPLVFNGIGGSWAFQDALTQDSTRAFTITNGTVQLKAGATSTVGAFATSGTNQKFLQSTLAGTQATLSQASGTVSASYLTVKDINATGGATWNAFYSNGNSDDGNNTGWNFGGTPAVSAEVTYSLRSFTTPRRF